MKLRRESGDAPFLEVSFGRQPFVFCAPHSAGYIRADGTTKPCEPRTAEFAMIAARRLKGACLVQNDARCLYPEISQRLQASFGQHTLLDLHGMVDDFDIDVCIGMGPTPSKRVGVLAAHLKKSFEKNGFVVSIDYPFGAHGEGMLTYFFQKMGGEALQLEFASRVRQKNNFSIRERVLSAMTEGLETLGFLHNPEFR